MTLALALQVFRTVAGSFSVNVGYQRVGLQTALMAVFTVVTLRMIVLFVSAQKHFVEGIQKTETKG